ncbi:MAG: Do family serine endopeptidase [Aureliella sp.]
MLSSRVSLFASCGSGVLLIAALTNPLFAQVSPTPGSSEQVKAIESRVKAAIKNTQLSVVSIARRPRDRVPTNQFAPMFGGVRPLDPLEDRDFVPDYFGTGVVIAPGGFVVTCAHVLGNPRENDYFVWCNGLPSRARVIAGARQDAAPSEDSEVGGIATARVLASDPFSDLAVLQVDSRELQPIELGDGSKITKGQFVVALGNPDAIARDGVPSASWGIVSNLKRFAPQRSSDPQATRQTIHAFGTLIQTDARLSPGTSGGALIDLDGKLVGITTSLSALRGDGRSAGFAIAVDGLFSRVIDSLRSGRLPEYGFLGIQPEDLPIAARQDGRRGAVVRSVLPGMPGEKAGLRANDVIVRVGDVDIGSRFDLFRELSRASVRSDVRLVVTRLDRPEVSRSLRARLSKKPATSPQLAYAVNAPAAWRGMTVDYITALPAELLVTGIAAGGRGRASVAVFDVEPNSAVWRAGVRPGDLVRSVAGQVVEGPDGFRAIVASQNGAVQIQIIRSGGVENRITVAAP